MSGDKRDGYSEGYREGYRDGYRDGRGDAPIPYEPCPPTWPWPSTITYKVATPEGEPPA